jgi:hypothetical protein
MQIFLTLQQAVRLVTTSLGHVESEDEDTNILRSVGNINQSIQRNIPEDLNL